MNTLLHNTLKLSVFTSLFLGSLHAAEQDLELNAIATTQELYALGVSYEVHEYVKIGAGALAINDLNSSATKTDDKFLGGYGIVEFKYPVADKLEVFADLVYISGKFDKTNESLNEVDAAGGLKYNLNETYDVFAGYTTETTSFAGVDYSITPEWKLTLCGSYNSEYNESQAIVGFSYNFGSGMNSALTTSAKYMAQDEIATAAAPVIVPT